LKLNRNIRNIMNRWTRNTAKHRGDIATNPGESILVEQDGVRLDDGDNKVLLNDTDNQIIVLTSTFAPFSDQLFQRRFDSDHTSNIMVK